MKWWQALLIWILFVTVVIFSILAVASMTRREVDYLIDEDGIHYYWEEYPPKPSQHALPVEEPPASKEMTLKDALIVIGRIAQNIEEMYDACECEQQGAPPCGACGREPARRA